ncbi:MAG: hypothetical protein HQK52_00320 [Oligoflexia bacterium]|nr:hypothetical protein [Oligoflexia bacterium]
MNWTQRKHQNGKDRHYLIIFVMIVVVCVTVMQSHQTALAAEICGRSAIVNYQEVMVDTTGNTKKGEGLRYFLDKDPISKKYLDEYQKRSSPKWYNAAIGTVGTGFFIFGLGNSGSIQESGIGSRRFYMLGGLSILVLNFLLVRTLEYNNERLLLRSVEEYNKRNLPKIYFTPYSENHGGRSESDSIGVAAGFIKEF